LGVPAQPIRFRHLSQSSDLRLGPRSDFMR